MNTSVEPPSPPSDANLPVHVPVISGSLVRADEPTATDNQVAALQGELIQERRGRDHDRFYSAMISGALMVLIVLITSPYVAGAFAMMVYFAAIILLGKRYGVEGVVQALEQGRRLLPGKGEEKD